MNNKFKKELGIDIASVLLPNQNINYEKWAVVACDQYTSEPEYWENVDKLIHDEPSTLHLIYPEVYLEETQDKKQHRIASINKTMCDYLDNGYFCEVQNSFIYVERTISTGKTRKGLVCAIDLEHYDFLKDSESLIRATEGTILDRLPPRILIREKACLELPHIMVLFDDPNNTVMEPIIRNKNNMKMLYSFNLMMNGGHVEGYQLNDINVLQDIYYSLLNLKSPEIFSEKYNVTSSTSPLLFAVGDGNHSLATAKSCWENIKESLSDTEKTTHPARYALVELVNVHDSGLEFEPIHRVLFNVNADNVLKELVRFYTENGVECGYEYMENLNEQPTTKSSKHIIPFLHNNKSGYIWVNNPQFTLEVGTLQNFLDHYIEHNQDINIDYVHGDEVVKRLSKQDSIMGFLLPSMKKGDLFKTVISDGALPRKTFSMGEAEDKRYYLECRKILPDHMR